MTGTAPEHTAQPVAHTGRVLWPRTVRPALASVLIPGWRTRVGHAAIDASIARAGVPEGVAAFIRRVVRATRLWPKERSDVARELCAHFADGAAAGRSEDQLLADFGDPILAAAMIRRAKKRGRPPIYRACVGCVQAVAGLAALALLGYGYLALRYFTGQPTLRRNYAAELSTPIHATPADQRAWPAYLLAIRALGPDKPFMSEKDMPWPLVRSGPNWDVGRAWIAEHAEGIELTRRAAARPIVGYVYSNITDPEYLAIRFPDFKPDPAMLEQPAENPLLIGVLLPHLGEMRRLARILRSDFEVAADVGENERAVADVMAMLGMAEQCYAERFGISRMVAIALASLAADSVLHELPRADFLTGEDRTRLAHAFAAFAGGRLSLPADVERMMWNDVVQRVYSDNERGDGHVIHSSFAPLFREFGIADPTSRSAAKFLLPAVAAAQPSRREFSAQVDRVAAAMDRDDALPPWRQAERTSDIEYDRLLAMLSSPLSFFKSLVGEDHDPTKYYWSRDIFETRRAAVLAACALESFRAEQGEYPESLDQLVPRLLTAVPRDPFDGAPLRYLRRDGRPLLYAVAGDLKDDAGREPTVPRRDVTGRPGGKDPPAAEPCDWVLYPVRDRSSN